MDQPWDYVAVPANIHPRSVDAEGNVYEDGVKIGWQPPKPPTPEQRARNLLERFGCPNAQALTAGDVVELANLFAAADRLETVEFALDDLRFAMRTRD